jgi:hypothetical protein
VADDVDPGQWLVWDGVDLHGPAAPLEEVLAVLSERDVAVPARYARPAFSRDRAHAIAAEALETAVERQTYASSDELHFDTVEYLDETPMWWTFRRSCREWLDRGLLPGSLICSIDKVDGHVWTSNEQEAFWAIQGRT